MKNETKQPELDLVDLAIKSGQIVITTIEEKDNENFLRQLKSARFMYDIFIRSSENKKMVAKETLESLIVLQQMLSKAIVNVYNVYDK